MTVPLQATLASLNASAAEQARDRRLQSRLDHVRDILGDDLAWIESALREAAASGAAPGCDAAEHLVVRGGKRVRPMALLLSASCFGPIDETARELGLVSELVHSATLLHDDVVDDGMDRRGVPASRRIWGNAVSVLAGDLLLVNALERTERAAPVLLPGLIATLRQLVDGEITQLRGRSLLDVSRETYDRILRGKTASLFRWATETGARVSGGSATAQQQMARFGEQLGMAFQLVDDALDYSSAETDKTPLADLREGKLTLPLVLAIERRPDLADPVRRIHAGDDSPMPEVHRAVIDTGACQAARDRAERHTANAIEALGSIAPGESRHLLEQVALELVRRDG